MKSKAPRANKIRVGKFIPPPESPVTPNPVVAAHNVLLATKAVNSIASVLKAGFVQDVYLYGSRAQGTSNPTSTWDFILDFWEHINSAQFFAINNALTAAIVSQAGQGQKIYVTSPQYDRESFTAWAMKSSKLIYSQP